MNNGIYEHKYYFKNTPENIANFIMQYRFCDITVTDCADNLICDTFGQFINRCPDQLYLRDKLLPILQKIQFGEVPLKQLRFKYDEQNECYIQV